METSSSSATLQMHIADDYKREKEIKKIAKVLKQLTYSTKNHNLRELDLARGIIERRKEHLKTWMQVLQSMMQTDSWYESLLMNYPKIDYNGYISRRSVRNLVAPSEMNPLICIWDSSSLGIYLMADNDCYAISAFYIADPFSAVSVPRFRSISAYNIF